MDPSLQPGTPEYWQREAENSRREAAYWNERERRANRMVFVILGVTLVGALTWDYLRSHRSKKARR
jgi:hypothetical protein